MSHLSALHNLYPDSTVWICGTGPSLDAIAPNDVTGPRIYLNRVAFALPVDSQSYWLVADDAWKQNIPGPWHETLRAVQANETPLSGVFRNPLMNGANLTDPPAGDHIYHWHATKEARWLAQPRSMVFRANTLYARAGTAAPAIHLAWFMGAKRIILVGIDGTDGYAARVVQWYDKPRRGGFGYGQAREDALEVAAALNLEVDDRTFNYQEKP